VLVCLDDALAQLDRLGTRTPVDRLEAMIGVLGERLDLSAGAVSYREPRSDMVQTLLTIDRRSGIVGSAHTGLAVDRYSVDEYPATAAVRSTSACDRPSWRARRARRSASASSRYTLVLRIGQA